jgi:hypothetical protein
VNRRGVAALGLALAASMTLGCETELPDPASPGATLYRTRCQGCHRLYQPGLMTAAMWRVQVERMQREFARRGMTQLSTAESELLLAYLDAHSSDAAGAAERPAETAPTNGH